MKGGLNSGCRAITQLEWPAVERAVGADHLPSLVLKRPQAEATPGSFPSVNTMRNIKSLGHYVNGPSLPSVHFPIQWHELPKILGVALELTGVRPV
jgi:hypothetical protein